MNKVAIFSLPTILLLIIASSPVYGQTSGPPFNWLHFCRNPAVDFAVTEPCETLTTPDGYTLTREGQRVVGCFLGAGLLLAADPTGTALGVANSLSQNAHLCLDVNAPLAGGNSYDPRYGEKNDYDPARSDAFTDFMNSLFGR